MSFWWPRWFLLTSHSLSYLAQWVISISWWHRDDCHAGCDEIMSQLAICYEFSASSHACVSPIGKWSGDYINAPWKRSGRPEMLGRLLTIRWVLSGSGGKGSGSMLISCVIWQRLRAIIRLFSAGDSTAMMGWPWLFPLFELVGEMITCQLSSNQIRKRRTIDAWIPILPSSPDNSMRVRWISGRVIFYSNRIIGAEAHYYFLDYFLFWFGSYFGKLMKRGSMKPIKCQRIFLSCVFGCVE